MNQFHQQILQLADDNRQLQKVPSLAFRPLRSTITNLLFTTENIKFTKTKYNLLQQQVSVYWSQYITDHKELPPFLAMGSLD